MTLSSAPQLPLNGQRHVHVETEPGQPHRRLVFLVRHAESRWNRAKAELGVLSMLCENDHGLSEKGLAQAQTLRSLLKEARISLDSASSDQQEDPWLRRLLKPGVVYASPFTRAIETAVIGLRDILPNDRVELMREAREHKNFGGADSTGIAVGDAIFARVDEDLRYLYSGSCGPEHIDEAVEHLNRITLDSSNVCDEWWGPFTGDSEEDLRVRVDEFVNRLRQTPAEASVDEAGSVVVVGHSTFFRNLFQILLAQQTNTLPSMGDPALLLKFHPMPCCGVVGAWFEWDPKGRASIVEVMPLLGTQLAPVDLTADGYSARNKAHFSGCVCGRGKEQRCVLA